MGREIRRVPPDWEHPRYDGFSDTTRRELIGKHRPLFDESYQRVSDEWIQGFVNWIAAGRPTQKNVFLEGRDQSSLTAWEQGYAEHIGREYEHLMYWEQYWPSSSPFHPGGAPPDPDSYRQQDWSDDEATAYQVYETVSEGTPVSPVFQTEQELIDWLKSSQGMSDEGARKFVEMGSVPSMMIGPTIGMKTNFEIAETFSGDGFMGRIVAQRTYELSRTSDRLLTKLQVAALLEVSGRTVDRLASAGELQRIRIGGSTRFRVADVQALVDRSAEDS
jgi:excisionase family DNA binding protein